jgi:hypothetical protein
MSRSCGAVPQSQADPGMSSTGVESVTGRECDARLASVEAFGEPRTGRFLGSRPTTGLPLR